MIGQALGAVFANAAVPQKIVLVTLAAAIPITLAATCLALARRAHGRVWRRLIAEIRRAAPALGLLVGALDSFHIARTIQHVPFDPTAKQLASGILEVSTFVGLGALAGFIAVVAGLVLSWAGAGYSVEHGHSEHGGGKATTGAVAAPLLTTVVLAILSFFLFKIFVYGLR